MRSATSPLCKRLFRNLFILSNERSEDSYLCLAVFLVFFFQEKSLITTDVHSYILVHL